MDIYILRDGQETGPFSEETARTLLEQGGVAAGDFAWHQGLADWLPLGELLAARAPVIPPAEVSSETPVAKSASATPKQKALLSYLGIALAADLSKDQAALLINDAMENPANTERLTQWNEERLRLHPDLFAAEIQGKKENRANRFFELSQTRGAEYFSGITKAHCQVLVGFLDVKFPHWDAREADATEHYFFPAVAEKFPQLVHKQWRGRLHYAEALKVAPEIVRKSPTSRLRSSATSPLVAITRGVVLGVVILGGLYLGYRTMQSNTTAAPIAEETPAIAPQPVASPVIETPAPEPVQPAAPPLAAVPSPSLPPIETLPPVPPTEPVPVAPPDPGMSAAPMATMATNSAPPMATAEPAMAPMAMAPSAVDTAPMAGLPGAEPPVPIPPPPATLPTPASLPSLPPEAAAIPPLSPGEMAPIPAPAFTAKTNLLLTKSVEVQLAYGKITLSPGTPVKLLSRQGPTLKVSYQNSVMSIPVTSTDAE